MQPPDACPNCGADLPPNARACPECGADEENGWSEVADEPGLDLPDENFDYDEFVKREFGQKNPVPPGIHWFWWVVAVLLIIVLLRLFLAFS
jgi:hypothetical protein